MDVGNAKALEVVMELLDIAREHVQKDILEVIELFMGAQWSMQL